MRIAPVLAAPTRLPPLAPLPCRIQIELEIWEAVASVGIKKIDQKNRNCVDPSRGGPVVVIEAWGWRRRSSGSCPCSRIRATAKSNPAAAVSRPLIIPEAAREGDIQLRSCPTFHRTSGMIYCPGYHCEMLPKLDVSHTFLSSWRCRPNLTFSEETLGPNGKTSIRDKLKALAIPLEKRDKLAQIFTNRVDKIMRKHSGIGVKTFMLHYYGSFINASYLNRWLQKAITPGIEELILSVCTTYNRMNYNFPCTLLFNGSGNSIRHLNLSLCAFHPMAGLCGLTRLHLSEVHITGDELGQLLSGSPAMEELKLVNCHKIISLKIPCLLHRLNYLKVFACIGLQVIENEAPNVCVVHIDGTFERLRVGDLLQVKHLEMIDPYETSLVHHARAKLPFIMPNLETLNLYSDGEKLSTPMLAAKFLYLRNLQISFGDGDRRRGFTYDYFSLVYFLDACPVLEDFVLYVTQTRVRHALISAEDSHLRQMPEHRHSSIKNVKIAGFCAAKSLVELTCHILENATSLECLTLDAIYDNSSRLGADRSCVHHKYGECRPVIDRCMIAHAHIGLWAIGRYIVEKVPSTVKLDVKKLCRHCHR